jgi:putative ABC transport system ATP-binding protein
MSVVVDVAGLVKSPVLQGIDLEVPAGRLIALAGRPGAGKTTLLDCLGGLQRPDRGSVHIGQERLTGLGDTALTRLRRDRIGFVFPTGSLLPTLSVRQNIRIGPELAGRRPDQRWFDTVTGLLGLTDVLRKRPAALRAEEQQRVACARAFLNRPDVVLADEPTGELERREAAELLGFVRMWVRKLGQAVLLATADPFVAAHADRVLVLSGGRIAEAIERPTVESVRAALER